MLRLISVNFCRVGTSIGFWACAAITFFICFTAPVSVESRQTSMTIFSILLYLPREELLIDTNLCAEQMLHAYRNGYFTLFCSMLVLFPFVNAFTVQREVGFPRYMLLRTGRVSYALGEIISLILCGCSAIGIGILCYSLFVWFEFPHLSAYSAEQVMSFMQAGSFPVQGLCFLCYCICSTSFGILLLSFCKNRYLILTIPFFAQHLLRQLSQGLLSTGFVNNNTALINFANLLSPEATWDLPYSSGSQIFWICLLHFGFICAASAVFCMVGNRRLDVGDF